MSTDFVLALSHRGEADVTINAVVGGGFLCRRKYNRY